jgi:DNA-binding FadR family transcriptional regulator
MEIVALELLASRPAPVGAITLAATWRAAGIERGEATAGRFLRSLDERSLTTSLGATKGRILTAKGSARLEQLRDEQRFSLHELALSRALAGSDISELTDLLNVRRLVEIECAGLAAIRATEDERASLIRLAQDHQHLATGSEETTIPSMTFHRHIAEASHNLPLIAIANLLLDPANDPLEKLLAMISHGIGDTGHQLDDHIVLAEAIQRGDAAAAREAMDTHITRLLAAVGRYTDIHPG